MNLWCFYLTSNSDGLPLVLALLSSLWNVLSPTLWGSPGPFITAYCFPDSSACVWKGATHDNPSSWTSGQLVLPLMSHAYSGRRSVFIYIYCSSRSCCIWKVWMSLKPSMGRLRLLNNINQKIPVSSWNLLLATARVLENT